MKGFLSEHSAEYAAVYAAHRAACEQRREVVPIYYWSSREGSRHASLGCARQVVRATNVFARRPKTHPLHGNFVRIKFNKVLFETAEEGREYGVPVLAACPLVAHLVEYRLDTLCAWFRVRGARWSGDQEVDVTLSGEPKSAIPEGVEGPLSQETLMNVVFEEARPQRLEELQESLRSIARQVNHGRFSYFVRYKPFTLLWVHD